MRLRPLALTPALVLLTGCAALAGAHGGPAGGGQGPTDAVPSSAAMSAIPWVSATPSGWPHALATPVPGSAARRCEASDLRAGFRGGANGGVVYLAPQTSACLTGGVPSIELRANDGPIAASPVSTTATPGGDIVLEREFAARIDLMPGEPVPPPLGGPGEATVRVEWQQVDTTGSDACAGGLKQISSMRLRLPGQSDAVMVENLVDEQGHPLTVCSPFLKTGPLEKDSTIKPLSPPRYWSYTINAPTSAAVGGTIDFTVTLQNVYYRTLQFSDGCPAFVEVLDGPNNWTTGKEWYVLNCEPIGPLQPGASATLAMKIAVPPSAPIGTYELSWDLDTGDVNYGAATATVDAVR